MNSDKHQTSGNALLYVLLALALIGALTMVISRQNNQASGQNLTKEQLELMTTKMIAYTGSVKNAVDQMLMSGTQIGNLDYLRPTESGFDTAPYINRVFHPDGGGVQYQPADKNVFTSPDTNPAPGWYLGRFNNVEWTPTTAQDIVLVGYGVSQEICAKINKKITGSETIPVANDYGEELFVKGSIWSGTNTDFTKAVCPACEGYPTLCVKDLTPDYMFYTVISGQ